MNKELMFSHDSTEWRTPLDFFLMLDEEFSFELDAAATEENSLCPVYFDKEDDALSDKNSWHPCKSIFINPPYGRGIGDWVAKAWHESQKGCTVVLLLPARTDTAWFHDWVQGKAEVRFLRGRIRFSDPEGKQMAPAPFPSLLAIYRPSHQRRFSNA